jgi:hypothetical protein
MKRAKIKVIVSAALLTLLWAGLRPAAANDLEGIGVTRLGDSIAVTITTGSECDYTAFLTESKPERIVIDLSGVVNNLPKKQFGGLPLRSLKSIRTSQFKSEPTPSARVVLDINRPVEFKSSYTGSRVIIKFAAVPDELASVNWKSSNEAGSAVAAQPVIEKPKPVVQAPPAVVQKVIPPVPKPVAIPIEVAKVTTPTPATPPVEKPVEIAKVTTLIPVTPPVEKPVEIAKVTTPIPVTPPVEKPVEIVKAPAPTPVEKPIEKPVQVAQVNPTSTEKPVAVAQKPAEEMPAESAVSDDAPNGESEQAAVTTPITGPQGIEVDTTPKRKTIEYTANDEKDPFAPLVGLGKGNPKQGLPSLENLKLVGVLEDNNDISSALLEDGEGNGYILKPNDRIQSGYLVTVTDTKAVFQVTEYGWTRTVALELQVPEIK